MINVSVIIPTYKRVEETVKTLRLLLKSQGLSTDFNAEFIVTDCTPEDAIEKALLREFSDKIIYTRPQRQGVSTNKNNGAKTAKNPILIFCDSDMEVEENSLLNTVNSLKSNSTAGMVTGKVIWRGGKLNGKIDRPSVDDRMEKIGQTTYTEAIFSRFCATYAKVFWDVGGYDEISFNMHGEGSDLSTRYWRAGYPLVYDSSIVVHHSHEAPFSIAQRIAHPEANIARDFLLLAYKYEMFDEKYQNFSRIIRNNFHKFGDVGYFKIIEGVGKYIKMISEVLPQIDKDRQLRNTLYDFKFLEIFSDKELFKKCINNAPDRLKIVSDVFI